MAHQIEHAHLPIRGLNLHIAQVGKGELGTVVFLHGFPEIWYSWRHQMLAAAATGYRAVAPDWRGAFVVAKDFGAVPAYYFALRHPGRTRGVACLGISFSHGPWSFDAMPEGFYILRWQEPGRAEADFGRHDVRRVVRTIYVLFAGADVPVAKEGQEIMDLADESAPLPEWFTEEDLDVYASLYHKSGFRYPLKMYRSLHKMPCLPDAKFQVPLLTVTGGKDYSSKLAGLEDDAESCTVDRFVPGVKMDFIPEGSHFVQEQLPEQVNELLLGFFEEHPVAAAT
ncbi:bifunctional epoxide hydrolase 2-like [Panicum miliaceum]|uniref:Bifunctional epoxide hydrolase 2-like n=1 Tax=Panicum miliaceum TaxID=4540 RepID=A0A3L6RCH4_PANMI|nr:bifunctional epoxide hydrolase 2-like [Panicum miliaceum]